MSEQQLAAKVPLALESNADVRKTVRWELLESWLGHFGWFTFNVIFLSNSAETNNNNLVFIGVALCTLAPLCSFFVTLTFKMEFVSRRILFGWLLQDHMIWVNFKDRKMKWSVLAFYFIVTCMSIAIAYYFVSLEKGKWAAIVGSITNGSAACLAFYFIWDFESSLDSLNRVILDSPNLSPNGVDTRALGHLSQCTVVQEHQLKMFCFERIMQYNIKEKERKSEERRSSAIQMVDIHKTLTSLADVQFDKAFREKHNVGSWSTSTYAFSLLQKELHPSFTEMRKALNCMYGVGILSLFLCEIAGFFAVESGLVQ